MFLGGNRALEGRKYISDIPLMGKNKKQKSLILQALFAVFALSVRYKIPGYNDRCNQLLIYKVHISLGTSYGNI